MTPWLDGAFDEASLVSTIPSRQAYGLPPGPAGYRLADLRCLPGRDGWYVEGLYSQCAVGLVLSGVFDYASKGRLRTAVPGTFLFANKSEPFSCRHLCGDGNRRLVMFFAVDLLEAVADDLRLDAARFPAASAPPSPLTPTVSGLMLRIARRRDDSDEAAAAIAAAALRGARHRSDPDNVPAADARRIVDVVRHVNAHFAAACTLDGLASVAGMGRFRFARIFRAVTGETPSQYVLNRRLSAAAARLAASRSPVTEIAYEVGFNDLSYFYARFRSAFGCAPGAWRRLQGA